MNPTQAPHACTHQRFQAHVSVGRLVNGTGFVAELQVQCLQCGLPCRFTGTLQLALDGLALYAPLAPATDPQLPAFGELRVDPPMTRH